MGARTGGRRHQRSQAASGALLRELIRLVDAGSVVPWVEAIDAVSLRFSQGDLVHVQPQSSGELTRLRREYREAKCDVARREDIVDLRGLELVLRATLNARPKRRPWDGIAAGTDEATPLPSTRAGCRREILARFADPRHPIRRVYVEGAHTQEIYGYDITRAVEHAHCITAVARDELLAVDFDGHVSWKHVEKALVVPLDDAGFPVTALPSGRGIQTFIGRDRRASENAKGVGIHVFAVISDLAAKAHWASVARSLGGDVRLGSQIRVPFFAYKTKRVVAVGRAAEFGMWTRDAREKRLYAAAFLSLSNLQRLVGFLRQIPLWSGVELYHPADAHPVDDAGWEHRRRVEDQRVGRNRSANPTDPLPRDRGASTPPKLSPQTVKRSIAAENRLSAKARDLLLHGDRNGRFVHANGQRTDRSRMGIWLLWRLTRLGVSTRTIKAMIQRRLPGLSAYWEREDGGRLLQRDLAKVTEARRLPRRAVAPAAIVAQIERKSFRMVALALLKLGARPAPGVRRLCELTGYSIRTISLALGWLEGRYIRKVGPLRGPGSTKAQQWEFIVPARLVESSKVNTYRITPHRHGRLLNLLDAATDDGVPLRLLRTEDLLDAQKGASWTNLKRRMGTALVRGQTWVEEARSRHAAERAEYRRRVRRAERRGVPFVTPAEARQRQVEQLTTRMAQTDLEGEYRVLRARVRKLCKGDLPDETVRIKSPNERWRELIGEWAAEQRGRGREVDPWLRQVAA